MLNTSTQNNGYNPSKNSFKLPGFSLEQRWSNQWREPCCKGSEINVLFNAGWETVDVFNSDPRILELADVETQLGNHRLEASNSKRHVRVLDVHLIVAAIADKEIVNREMPDTNTVPPLAASSRYSKEQSLNYMAIRLGNCNYSFPCALLHSEPL